MADDIRPTESDKIGVEAENTEAKPGLLKRIFSIPRIADWIAMFFSVLAAFLELLKQAWSHASNTELLDTGIIASAMVGLLLLCFSMFDHLTRETRRREKLTLIVARQGADLEKERLAHIATRAERDKEAEHRKKISECFTALSEPRHRLRSSLLAAIVNGPVEEALRRAVLDDLAEKLTEYLRVLANTAVDVVSVQNRTSCEYHVNIKLLERYLDSVDVRYRVRARSSKPDMNRVLDDDRRKEPHRLSDNGLYQKVLMQRGKTDYLCVDDIEVFLAGWARDVGFSEPHPSVAPKFYGSNLVVAIQGLGMQALDDRLPDSAATVPFGDDSVLFGFICIDCKEKNAFDGKWDLAVMRQIAGEVFDAVRLYYVACASVGKASPLRLVPAR